jgi:hypothetical protein
MAIYPRATKTQSMFVESPQDNSPVKRASRETVRTTAKAARAGRVNRPGISARCAKRRLGAGACAIGAASASRTQWRVGRERAK